MSAGFAQNGFYDRSKEVKKKTAYEKARDVALDRNEPWTLSEPEWGQLLFKDKCSICRAKARRRGNYLWLLEWGPGYAVANCRPLCRDCYDGVSCHGWDEFSSLVSFVPTTRGEDQIPIKQRTYEVFKAKAAERRLEVTLTVEQFSALQVEPCFYCGRKKRTSGFGIDRYDNSKHYTPENSMSCCWPCNHAKGAEGIDLFIERCREVVRRWDAGLSKKQIG